MKLVENSTDRENAGKDSAGSPMKEEARSSTISELPVNTTVDLPNDLSRAIPLAGNVDAPVHHALQEEQRIRLAEAAGHIGTWEWNPAEPAPALSPELGRIFGIDPGDPDRASKWAANVWPDDFAAVRANMEMAYTSGEMEFEYRYMHPQLGLRWLYCKGRSYEGKSGLFGIVQDLTKRKTDEEDLRRLAAIVASSADAIVSKDLNGIVSSWNECAEKMYGYTASEMIGRSIKTIIPPELHDDEDRILATIARGERIEHFETVRIRKDGEPIQVSITISPIKDESGKIVGAAKIARDISQQKKAEHALLVSEQLATVGRLAATVAHEINNPLEAVVNLVYLAKTACKDENVKGYLNVAEEQLATVSQLTRQTLGFYRETAGARRLKADEIVESVLSVSRARARNRSIKLVSQIEEHPEFYAVPGEVRQVIANLVNNSIDAIKDSGEIVIRIGPTKRWKPKEVAGIRITVADNGPGIPAATLPHIFEPFFTTKRDVGTGLGLWVCKEIIAGQGGTIRCCTSSRREKSGTVFSVFLPLNLPQAPAQRKRAVKPETQRIM